MQRETERDPIAVKLNYNNYSFLSFEFLITVKVLKHLVILCVAIQSTE